jgi:spermidine synthase
MGGGTLVQRLQALQFQMDVVEIDRRIHEVAVGYFGLDPNLFVHIDDARHFVRINDNSYDLVIYDVFKGEEAPAHILTLESVNETKAILDPEGMIIINFYGYLEGSLGLLTRSVAKTLTHAGFQVELFATPGDPDHRNVVMVAWTQSGPRPHAREIPPERQILLDYHPQPLQQIDLKNAYVLTDERPQLQLFAEAAMQWRRLYNAYFFK